MGLDMMTTAKGWNSMSIEERVSVLRRSGDGALGSRAWDSLVDRMARSTFEDMTDLQREMVVKYLPIHPNTR